MASVLLRSAALLLSCKQFEQKTRDTIESGLLPDVHDQLFQQTLFGNVYLCNLMRRAKVFVKELLQSRCREGAKYGVAYDLDGIGPNLSAAFQVAKKIAAHQELQHLPLPG